MLPKALIIGPMKAGTTWIHNYLEWRGDVCLPQGVKETFYFDKYHDRGVHWYGAHFSRYDPNSHRIVVEVAPSLFHSDLATQRVAQDLGDIALIVGRRDPIARSWSHYTHLRRYGYTRKPLSEAVQDFPQIIAASRYSDGIAKWRAALPGASITVLDLEDLKNNPEEYAAKLCGALGIDFISVPTELRGESNKGAVPRSYLAAKFGRALSYRLRGLGLYGVINAAKAAGLRSIFFGSAKGEATRAPSAGEQAFLRRELGLSDD